MKNKAVFVDRDGTMARDAHYCSRPEDFELFPNTARALKLLKQHGFKLIVITNQSGIGRNLFTEETLARIHEKMEDDLKRQGASVDAIYYCPHHPDEKCDCRKPNPRLVLQAVEEHNIDLKRSYVIGDLPMDVGLGNNVGCKTVLIADNEYQPVQDEKPAAIVPDLLAAAEQIVEWDSRQASKR